MANDQRQIIDSRTNEQIVVHEPSALKPPDPKTVSDINAVAGSNPPAVNLRDHPEFNGKEFTVVDVRFTSGETGGKKTTYMVAAGYLCNKGEKPSEKNFVVLLTGSSNVLTRVMQAFSQNALPVKGTLRLGGKAWFLD